MSTAELHRRSLPDRVALRDVPIMTTARFSIGLAACVIVFSIFGVGIHRLRTRLFYAATRGEGALISTVLALSTSLVLSQALGTFGWFHLGPLALAHLGIGLACVAIAARRSPKTGSSVDVPSIAMPRWVDVATFAGVALVVACWTAWAFAVRFGADPGIDTLWYHLPIAARFVQSGQTLPIHFIDLDPVSAFFPANSEIPHALGMVFTGSDALTPFVNLGWLALALGAAWVFGRRFGNPHVAMLAIAALLATPMMTLQSGSALNDIAGIALLMTAIACLPSLASLKTVPAMAIVPSGLALGLAIGTKFTVVGVAGLIALFIVAWCAKGMRLRRFFTVSACLAATGSYWFVRNIIAVGNPIPSMHIALGPVELTSVTGPMPTSRFAAYFLHADAWRGTFLPIMGDMGGPLFAPLMLGGMALAVFTALRSTADATTRALCALAVGAALVYAVTPQYLAFQSEPVYFRANLRYVTPMIVALIFALVAARRHAIVAASIAFVWLITAQLSPQAWPPTSVNAAPFIIGAALATIIFLACAHAAIAKPRTRYAAVVVVCIIGSFAAVQHQSYQAARFTYPRGLHAMTSWAADTSGERIVVAPSMFWPLGASRNAQLVALDRQVLITQFPLYGFSLGNRVQMAVYQRGERLVAPSTCTAWVQFLRNERATIVVSMHSDHDLPRDARINTWTAHLAHADQFFDYALPSSSVGSHYTATRISPGQLPLTC